MKILGQRISAAYILVLPTIWWWSALPIIAERAEDTPKPNGPQQAHLPRLQCRTLWCKAESLAQTNSISHDTAGKIRVGKHAHTQHTGQARLQCGKGTVLLHTLHASTA